MNKQQDPRHLERSFEDSYNEDGFPLDPDPDDPRYTGGPDTKVPVD